MQHQECSQAAGPTFCNERRVDGGSEQRCASLHYAAEGESCASTAGLTVFCANRMLCHPEDQTCVRPAERGEPCVTGPVWGDTCAQGSVCDRLNTRRCIAPLPPGSPCTKLEECEGLLCHEGVCKAPLMWAEFGTCE